MSNNPELPNWPGASVVYSRLGKINAKLAAAAYAAGMYKGKKWVWHLPDHVAENIVAMNLGDEEACKAGVGRDLFLLDDLRA